jgi:hypothetical protein
MNFIDPFEKKKISFSTHKQLDEYAYSLIKIKDFENKKEVEKLQNKFLIENPEDYHLLKSYDRAFWMVYLKLYKQMQDAQIIINENEVYFDSFTDEEKIKFNQLKKDLKSWNEKIKDFEPCNSSENDKCNCFFGDPRTTFTL